MPLGNGKIGGWRAAGGNESSNRRKGKLRFAFGQQRALKVAGFVSLEESTETKKVGARESRTWSWGSSFP
jgi:hypothetical protein